MHPQWQNLHRSQGWAFDVACDAHLRGLIGSFPLPPGADCSTSDVSEQSLGTGKWRNVFSTITPTEQTTSKTSDESSNKSRVTPLAASRESLGILGFATCVTLTCLNLGRFLWQT